MHPFLNAIVDLPAKIQMTFLAGEPPEAPWEGWVPFRPSAAPLPPGLACHAHQDPWQHPLTAGRQGPLARCALARCGPAPAPMAGASGLHAVTRAPPPTVILGGAWPGDTPQAHQERHPLRLPQKPQLPATCGACDPGPTVPGAATRLANPPQVGCYEVEAIVQVALFGDLL